MLDDGKGRTLEGRRARNLITVFVFSYSLHETTVAKRQLLENTTRIKFSTRYKIACFGSAASASRSSQVWTRNREKGEGPPALPRMFNCQLLAWLDPD
jgi:hypothetical protein